MLSLILFLSISQGSIADRTQLTVPKAMSAPEWKEWVATFGADLNGLKFDGPLGPFSGGFFERLDSLAQAQGKRLQVKHKSIQLVSGPKGILSQGNSLGRCEVQSVLVGKQWDDNRDYLRIGIQASWHPNLHPILLQAGSFRLLAKDNKPVLTAMSSWQAVEEDFQAHLELNAAKPPRALKEFDSLEGSIRMVVPNQLLWLDLGGVLEREKMDYQVGKTRVKRLGTQFTSRRISLEAEINPGPSEYGIESYQEGILTGLAALIGPDKSRRLADGQQILESGEGKIRVRYDWLFPKDQPGQFQPGNQRFGLRIGDNFKEMEMPVKFGAVELP